eukprot:8527292-Pyramimonas_sp.AAC.1
MLARHSATVRSMRSQPVAHLAPPLVRRRPAPPGPSSPRETSGRQSCGSRVKCSGRSHPTNVTCRTTTIIT